MVHVSVLGVNAARLAGVEASASQYANLDRAVSRAMPVTHPSENVYESEIDLPRGMWVHRKINVDKLKVVTDLDCDRPPLVQVSPGPA